MKWEMEILSPASYLSSRNWFGEESKSTKWTSAENKMFENALAVYDKDTPDRWQKVAEMIPGKTVGDVIKQYRELEADVSSIEAGLVPIPGYSTSPFTLDWVNSNGYDGLKQSYGIGGKRSSSGRPADHERKKGVPWTEEEHKLFLMGLKKYGKGDWRNISRNFVVTRTPTQVASHAQKYFIRQLSGGKDKRRASIHDITTVNLNDMRTPSPDNKGTPSPEQSSVLTQQPNSAAMPRTHFQWNPPCGGATMAFNSAQGSMLMSSPYGVPSYGLKMQGQSLQRSAAHESYFGPQNLVFQMQSAEQYPQNHLF
ncbi:Transcription factor MYB1R1 [Gossypium arboreum]|uniref:Transcription factor MYB1R1 n=2 Tax=Gossypium arboreum TaxID=29729 RepID=A0A0B0MSI1_GOSAR|nr:transcription factor DIVARICATA [Gossypium arboreum]KHG02459.1 Transcription factor MYB1R1 [Gossypium arboreum]